MLELSLSEDSELASLEDSSAEELSEVSDVLDELLPQAVRDIVIAATSRMDKSAFFFICKILSFMKNFI